MCPPARRANCCGSSTAQGLSISPASSLATTRPAWSERSRSRPASEPPGPFHHSKEQCMKHAFALVAAALVGAAALSIAQQAQAPAVQSTPAGWTEAEVRKVDKSAGKITL